MASLKAKEAPRVVREPAIEVSPEPEVIELSSDSESDHDDDLDDADDEIHRSDPEPVLSSPSSSKRKSEDHADEDKSLKGDSPASKRQKLPMRVKDTEVSTGHWKGEIEIPIPNWRQVRKAPETETADQTEDAVAERKELSEAETFSTSAVKKGSHFHFDDGNDEPDQFYTALEAPKGNPLEAADPKVPEAVYKNEESDDDAPPEVVSLSQAAADTRKSIQIAAKAAELQATAQKRKRQERDALFKGQAQSRKRVLETANQTQGLGGAKGSAPDDAAEKFITEKPVSFRRKRVDKSNIPDLLPAELLESDEEDENDSVAPSLARTPKKMKFNTAERKLAKERRPPKDQRVGSTIYKVMAGKGDENLAPKMRKQSRHFKQELMTRRRVSQKQGGFFVKR